MRYGKSEQDDFETQKNITSIIIMIITEKKQEKKLVGLLKYSFVVVYYTHTCCNIHAILLQIASIRHS